MKKYYIQDKISKVLQINKDEISYLISLENISVKNNLNINVNNFLSYAGHLYGLKRSHLLFYSYSQLFSVVPLFRQFLQIFKVDIEKLLKKNYW